MLKQIFLPEKVNNSFLFSRQVLGLEITRTALVATLVTISGKNTFVKEFYTEPIVKKDDEENEQSIINALKSLQQKINTSFYTRIIFPNHLVIFKELTVPFVEDEQIQQILPYELESQIPFPLKDVLFDFLVLKRDIQQKKSRVLVALVTLKDVDYYVNLFQKAEYTLDTITVDLFAFYGMCFANPVYNELAESTALVDVGFAHTTIAYITNKQFMGIRTINQGIATLAKNIAEKTGEAPAQVMEFITRFGFVNTDKDIFNNAIDQELTSFTQQMQFTFDAFATQIPDYQAPQKIILLSKGAFINALDTKLSSFLNISTNFFDIINLTKLKNLKLKDVSNKIPQTHVLPLGATYPFTPVGYFNLLAHTKTSQARTLLRNQFLAGIFTFIALLGLGTTYTYMQYSFASRQINSARNSALAALPKEFEITERNLKDAVSHAKEKLRESAALWEGISGQRISFLNYLQELGTIIDRESVGFNLKKMILEKDLVILEDCSVRDWPALTLLINHIAESSLFTLKSAINDPKKFSIRLAVKNSNEESV